MPSEHLIVFVNKGRLVYLSAFPGSQVLCLHIAAKLLVDSGGLLVFLLRVIVVSDKRLFRIIKQGYT
jgi:hypothetical protein